jgi:hypothetical protein
MRKNCFVIAALIASTLPAYSQMTVQPGASPITEEELKLSMAFFEWEMGAVQASDGRVGILVNGVWQPWSKEACLGRVNELISYYDALIGNISKDENHSCFGYLPSHNLNVAINGLYLYMRDAVHAWYGMCVAFSEADAERRRARYFVSRLTERRKEKARLEASPPSGGAGGSVAGAQAQPSDKGAARESKLVAGSRASMVEPYLSQRMPNSGGAGGSEVLSPQSQPQPPAVTSGGAGGSEVTTWQAKPDVEWKLGPDPTVVPSGGAGGSATSSAVIPGTGGAADGPRVAVAPASGGAGGSEQTRVASVCPAQQTQQACDPKSCDPKSFGDAQLRLLLADPKTRARLASLIAEEPTARKTKTEPQNRRGKRVRAPTDADIARSNSGISPEAASAIGTVIGVGLGVGLNNIGRRGGSGAGPYRGASGAAPRRGTSDGPPR